MSNVISKKVRALVSSFTINVFYPSTGANKSP